MQPELERWIREHAFPLDLADPKSAMAVSVDDLRALLDGKVLADAEPVSFHCGNCHEGPLYKAAGAGEE